MPLIYAEGSCYSIDKQTKNGSIFNVDIGIVQFCYVCTFKMIKGKQEMSMSLWIKGFFTTEYPIIPALLNSMHSVLCAVPPIHLINLSSYKSVPASCCSLVVKT